MELLSALCSLRSLLISPSLGFICLTYARPLYLLREKGTVGNPGNGKSFARGSLVPLPLDGRGRTRDFLEANFKEE